ncbi:SDR family oxidoreductase [Candidatus Bathyarchaeota archaeon]|nr:MAG: SDR family oxidoreductase [Candidatus Bathyarchaeota archaeon]
MTAHLSKAYSTRNARESSLPNSHALDITNHEATLSLVDEIGPDAIVNTAALHNVDYCETHHEEAIRVNVKGTKNLVDAAAKNGSRLVHVSTDYVFDGKKGHYTESDAPNPPNYYAMTKLKAEKAVLQSGSYAIARPSVVYGWNKLESTGVPSSSGKTINFAMYVLERLAKKETVKAVRDQFSSPTFADNLADALMRLVLYQENGLFHTAGRSCASRYEFALKLAETFEYNKDLVQPVLSNEFKQLAQRPLNSCLDVDRTEQVLGVRFMTLAEGIREMRVQEIAGRTS